MSASDGLTQTSDECEVTSTNVEDKGNFDAAENAGAIDNVKDGNENVESEAVQSEPAHSNAERMEVNPYDYLNRDEFTSERFKVEIKGMHRQVGFKQLKKKMKTLGLNPHKVKILKWGAFVTFKSAEERDKAINDMDGVTWKGNILHVSIAKPRTDPGLETLKRKLDECDNGEGEKRQRTDKDQSDISPSERLIQVVAPLSSVPYNQQLEIKTQKVRDILTHYYSMILHQNVLLQERLPTEKDEKSGRLMVCPIKPIECSSALTYYRNKCEFTIGKDLEGNDRTVGFNYGKHKGGDRSVGSPQDLVTVSKAIEAVRSTLQIFIKEKFTHIPSYDAMTYKGFWRTATIRSTLAGDTMLAVEVCESDWDNKDVRETSQALKEYFISSDCRHLRLQSLYYVLRQRSGDPLTEVNCRMLFGDSYLIEECLGLKFQISLTSFFQVNTRAAEVLYSKIRQLCTTGNNVVVLDICCGTGTIGLSIAKSVLKVIGVEMCVEAVEDAKANAKRNEIDNIEFFCGKVEDVLPGILERLDPENEIIAIVDPPRAGLHPSVIGFLRKHLRVQSIIYVACNPEASGSNFVDLTRQESNRVRGFPFIPIEATPVDLFPQTKHVELVTLWKRLEFP